MIKVQKSTKKPGLYGVKMAQFTCDHRNGTLCNNNFDAYETSLELKTQTVRPLRCYKCSPTENSTLPGDFCSRVSDRDIMECEDLTYTECFTSTSGSFITRGCSKPGQNLDQVCSKPLCNKEFAEKTIMVTDGPLLSETTIKASSVKTVFSHILAIAVFVLFT